MKMLIGLLICSVTIFKTDAQKTGFKKFEGKARKFTFYYPVSWVFSKEEQTGTYFSEKAGEKGGMNVQILENISIPVEKTRKNVLLYNYKHTDNISKVKMVVKQNLTEFYYQFENDGTRSMVKAFQKNRDFYAIIINWDTVAWKKYSDTLLYSYNSFKPIQR